MSLGCDNGNMLYMHDGSYAWNYTFDTLNRLTHVQKDGVLSALYIYDADGRRVRSWENVSGGVSTDYVYSGLNVIDEISGGAHERHVYAGGMHLASNTTGTVEYYHVDHLGSTRLKTAANGSVIYESNYEPFGPSSDETGDEDYRYTGKQEDPTGLYYYGARYYDPATGRFITRDTVFGDLTDPQSQNRYVYCRNNPHKYIDPDGKVWNIAIGAVTGAGLNVAFYFLELAVTGGKLDTNVLVAKAISGGISGAVAGSTFGFSLTYGRVTTYAVKPAIQVLGDTVATIVENEIISPESTTEENQKAYCESMGPTVVGSTGEGASIIFEDTQRSSSNVQLIKHQDNYYPSQSIMDASGYFVGTVLVQSLFLIDKWWEQTYTEPNDPYTPYMHTDNPLI